MNSKAKELAIHNKDTGSSEIQIALLTEKIETLSQHIKKFKKLPPKTFLIRHFYHTRTYHTPLCVKFCSIRCHLKKNLFFKTVLS